MAINTKDLHKICGKLREDRFLTVYVETSLLFLSRGTAILTDMLLVTRDQSIRKGTHDRAIGRGTT